MKRMRFVLMLGLTTVAPGLLGISSVEAQNVSCGDTLGPGGSFTITNEVGPCTTPAGLFVAGPVTVNLNGHTVTCDTSGGGDIGIDIQGSGAVLENGRVTACKTGVQIEGHTSKVSNVLAENNLVAGFQIIGAGHNTLVKNAASFNGVLGFSVDSSSNSFTGNTAVGAFAGFVLGNGATATHNTLHANTAMENTSGFVLATSSRNTSLSANEAFANGGGIEIVSGSTHNIVSGNVALGNKIEDLEDNNPSCDSNTWTKNVFLTHSQSCIH